MFMKQNCAFSPIWQIYFVFSVCMVTLTSGVNFFSSFYEQHFLYKLLFEDLPLVCVWILQAKGNFQKASCKILMKSTTRRCLEKFFMAPKPNR